MMPRGMNHIKVHASISLSPSSLIPPLSLFLFLSFSLLLQPFPNPRRQFLLLLPSPSQTPSTLRQHSFPDNPPSTPTPPPSTASLPSSSLPKPSASPLPPASFLTPSSASTPPPAPSSSSSTTFPGVLSVLLDSLLFLHTTCNPQFLRLSSSPASSSSSPTPSSASTPPVAPSSSPSPLPRRPLCSLRLPLPSSPSFSPHPFHFLPLSPVSPPNADKKSSSKTQAFPLNFQTTSTALNHHSTTISLNLSLISFSSFSGSSAKKEGALAVGLSVGVTRGRR